MAGRLLVQATLHPGERSLKEVQVVYAGKSHTVTTSPGKAITLRTADFRTKR